MLLGLPQLGFHHVALFNYSHDLSQGAHYSLIQIRKKIHFVNHLSVLWLTLQSLFIQYKKV